MGSMEREGQGSGNRKISRVAEVNFGKVKEGKLRKRVRGRMGN